VGQGVEWMSEIRCISVNLYFHMVILSLYIESLVYTLNTYVHIYIITYSKHAYIGTHILIHTRYIIYLKVR